MADLSLAPAEERSYLKPILISVAVLAVVAAALFLLNPRGIADVTVTHVDLFAPHTEYKSLAPKAGMHVLDSKKTTGPIGAAAEYNEDSRTQGRRDLARRKPGKKDVVV